MTEPQGNQERNITPEMITQAAENLRRQEVVNVHKIDCSGLDLVGLVVVISFLVFVICESIWG